MNSYTTTISVNKPASDLFRVIRDVSMWWSKDFEGECEKEGDLFVINHPGRHYSKQQLIEVVPDKKMVWLVTESTLNWLKDPQEWTNTKMIFDISVENDQTVLHFTHEGLVPSLECYERCSQGWSMVILDWLKNCIDSFHLTITVNTNKEKAMQLISRPDNWWVTGITGVTDKLGGKFHVPMGETRIDFEIIVYKPGKRINWKVTGSHIPWLKNIHEWTGTEVVFNILSNGDTTRIDFTHVGLVPTVECYKGCEQGWTEHIAHSLVQLINEGKGAPKSF